MVGQVPGRLGAELLAAARDAFTQGLQLTFAISAVVAIGGTTLVMRLRRQVGTTSERQEQPEPSPDRLCEATWAP